MESRELEKIARFLDQVGQDSLFTYYNLAEDSPDTQVEYVLRKRRNWAQGQQANPKYRTEASAELSGDLKLQLHARRLTLPHPSSGMLILEAPLSPEMKAGFARFGFDEHEADPEPFGRKRR